MGAHGSSAPEKGKVFSVTDLTCQLTIIQLEESLSTVLLSRYRYDSFREEILQFIDEDVLHTLKRSVGLSLVGLADR
jgi:hypothetical protein